MSSDVLPGLPTQEQILEMRKKGTQPTREGGFGYLRRPDRADNRSRLHASVGCPSSAFPGSAPASAAPVARHSTCQIGRASCRERGLMWERAAALKRSVRLGVD